MREALERFVASLAIPADRKDVVLAELSDHVASAREAAVRDGRDPDQAARAALGDLEGLRRSLEAVEPAFRVTRGHAMVRGLVAGVLVAIVLDQGGVLMRGALGALVTIAIAAVAAPPRALDLLRADLRARRLRASLGVGGVPIGPALTYGFTVAFAPFAVWIGLIVARALGGNTHVDVPWTSFAVVAAMYLVLLVEGIRAHREAAA